MAEHSPLPFLKAGHSVKSSTFGARNAYHANTQIEFPKMPNIDTRELNSNSGLTGISFTPHQAVNKKRPLEIADSFQSKLSPIANAANSFFHTTAEPAIFFGKKDDPKDVIKRMRLKLKTHVLDTSGGKDDSSKLEQ